MLPFRYWTELTTEDFRKLPMNEVIAVLPVAAIEQHGPHLPVGVDTFITRGYLDLVLEEMPGNLNVLVLPIQTIGKSHEHLAFPGTLTFSAETAIGAWVELGESIHRAGCRKLVIVNSHGGNWSIVDIVARELRVRLAMVVVTTSWSRLGLPDGLFEGDERLGIHGGDVETSLMLSFRPELVQMDKAKNFASRADAMERDFVYLRTDRPAGFAWMSQDLNPAGVVGNALKATAEKGDAAARHGAKAFVTLLQEVARFELGSPSS
jgi:creatinine amidohydrolase